MAVSKKMAVENTWSLDFMLDPIVKGLPTSKLFYSPTCCVAACDFTKNFER